jgi:hypothetical protein
MDTEQGICLKDRKFVQHPSDIIIDINNTIDNSRTHNVECNGLAFQSNRCFKKGQNLNINIDLGQMRFNGNARVSWCKKNSSSYDIGIEFLESCNAFEVKMILQVCQIKDFIEQKEKQEKEIENLSETNNKTSCNKSKDNKACEEWILKNAASF